jgi:hypothetical protein
MGTTPIEQDKPAPWAARAVGAMFFSIFGGAWIVLWSVSTFKGNMIVPLVAATCALLLFALAWRQYRQFRHTLEADKDSPAEKRKARLFHIINAGQWIVIVIGANVLANIGLGAWIIPLAIFVIGLHFLPLARLFNNPPHYVAGVALILVAVAYPLMSPQGPQDPIGCLGAGLILWGNALWALRRQFSLGDAAR